MDIISTRGPYTHLWWCTAGEGDPANSATPSSCLQPVIYLLFYGLKEPFF